MSTEEATYKTLYQTIWIATSEHKDVNKLQIDFNDPTTCQVTLLPSAGSVKCTWFQNHQGAEHSFRISGGSITLSGSVLVAQGTGEAQGSAAGAPAENWSLTKQ